MQNPSVTKIRCYGNKAKVMDTASVWDDKKKKKNLWLDGVMIAPQQEVPHATAPRT